MLRVQACKIRGGVTALQFGANEMFLFKKKKKKCFCFVETEFCYVVQSDLEIEKLGLQE